MKQEDKQLLLKDLAARLFYNVRGEVGACKNCIIYPHDIEDFERGERNIKPYLRPMSSMTEEEEREFQEIKLSYYCDEDGFILFDWLNAHHFDYRDLIEKGLAIALTEDNNPYKK